MLDSLTIQNIVLIEKLDLKFHPGLTILSGETGAGKSILLDSLGLALGGRSDLGLVRAGEQEASVSVSFLVTKNHPACQLLEQNDITLGDKISIRRKITKDGRSRAMVNEQNVNVNFLKKLGSELVEIQGQFDQHRLLNTAHHLQLLDDFGGIDKTALKNNFADYQNFKRKLQMAEQASAQSVKEQEFIQYSIDELERLAPEKGDGENLETERNLLMNSTKISDALGQVAKMISDSHGATQTVEQALKILEKLNINNKQLRELCRNFESALVEITEAEQNLNALISATEADPERLQMIDDRLFALKDAARKHRVEVEDLPDLLIKFRMQISMIENGDQLLRDLKQSTEQAKAIFESEVAVISAKRTIATEQLRKALMAELPALKMAEAEFFILLKPKNQNDWNHEGGDEAHFMVRSNPGQNPGALHKIASGGELSRILLALNLVFSKIRNMAVLLFDEVDSGLGGEVAAAMGKRLKQLGTDRQVLVITHSPQIAAIGNNHYHVSKIIAQNSTTSHVKKLSDQERLEEIARMLSDGTITNAARAAALKLLQTPIVEAVNR